MKTGDCKLTGEIIDVSNMLRLSKVVQSNFDETENELARIMKCAVEDEWTHKYSSKEIQLNDDGDIITNGHRNCFLIDKTHNGGDENQKWSKDLVVKLEAENIGYPHVQQVMAAATIECTNQIEMKNGAVGDVDSFISASTYTGLSTMSR